MYKCIKVSRFTEVVLNICKIAHIISGFKGPSNE